MIVSFTLANFLIFLIFISGSTVFVLRIKPKPGQDPTNDPTISEISTELCSKLDTGEAVTLSSGTDNILLYPIGGSCIQNYDYQPTTTTTSTSTTSATTGITMCEVMPVNIILERLTFI